MKLMYRQVFIIIFLIIVGVLIVVAQQLFANRADATPETLLKATPIVCQIIDPLSTPDLKRDLAIAELYESIPQLKTPVAIIATQDKPFEVGCLPSDH
jgi:hypothetical protein